jgi:hypothetical protein
LTVICDWLSVSTPIGDGENVVPQLAPILDAAAFNGLPGGDTLLLSQSPSMGLVRVVKIGDVAVVSASGAALADLRGVGQFADYLAVVGGVPHRVTTLHATLDVPVDAAPIVRGLYAAALSGKVALSRKALGVGDVELHLSRREFDGQDTGTVYIGGRRSQLRAAIYDKRHERLAKGCADPGPLTRYEMRFKGKVGATLRDAWSPERIFYHGASPDILPRPDGVLPWEPIMGGFDLPPRTEFSASELMRMKLGSSPDIKRLVDLALECGPGGLDLLCQRIRDIAYPRAPHFFRDAALTAAWKKSH